MAAIKIIDAARIGRIPPVAQAALKFLQSAPADEVYPLRELAARIRYSADRMADIVGLGYFTKHRMRLGLRYLYGSSKAVERLRRQLENR